MRIPPESSRSTNVAPRDRTAVGCGRKAAPARASRSQGTELWPGTPVSSATRTQIVSSNRCYSVPCPSTATNRNSPRSKGLGRVVGIRVSAVARSSQRPPCAPGGRQRADASRTYAEAQRVPRGTSPRRTGWRARTYGHGRCLTTKNVRICRHGVALIAFRHLGGRAQVRVCGLDGYRHMAPRVRRGRAPPRFLPGTSVARGQLLYLRAPSSQSRRTTESRTPSAESKMDRSPPKIR